MRQYSATSRRVREGLPLVASGPVDPVPDALREGSLPKAKTAAAGFVSGAKASRVEPGRPQAGSPKDGSFSRCINSLNRSGRTDSQNSLDGMHYARDIPIMQNEDVIHLYRIDPTRNMARFYRLSSVPSLFGDICVVREWGRISRPGRMRMRRSRKPLPHSTCWNGRNDGAAIETRAEWDDVRR
jgi:hypothetical protein